MINYYLITKPGIIFGNIITLVAGFFLAAKGDFNPTLFFYTVVGLALIIASACIINNYLDSQIDRMMERTKNRPLAAGTVSKQAALLLAGILGSMGFAALFFQANPLSALLALAGFLIYILPYTLLKRHSTYATAIGSLAGAVPPVVGYCAVSNQVDIGAILLFFMLVCWQMPHFFAIAVYHMQDYKKAELPLLPIEKGIPRTILHMIAYILGFLITTILLTHFKYTGALFLCLSVFASFTWLLLCLAGFRHRNEQLWGRQMFQWSLVLILSVCLIIPFGI